MTAPIDLTVIVPFHELNDSSFALLTQALRSLTEQKSKNFKVVFATNSDTHNQWATQIMPLCVGFPFSWHLHDLTYSYQYQINSVCANALDTKYFAVLQYDDVVLPNWTLSAMETIRAEPLIDVALPIIIQQNSNGEFLGLSNEAIWVNKYAVQPGVVDIKVVRDAADNFMISLIGAVFNAETFVDNGGYKPNLEWFFDYELLLRLLENGAYIKSTGKYGVAHRSGHENSMYSQIFAPMTLEEKTYWFDTARKEYFYDYERPVGYTHPQGVNL